MIAPFFSDINTASQGDVWFRESEVPAMLAKADECVKQGFPSSTFSATHLIIATWDNVSAADTPDGMVSSNSLVTVVHSNCIVKQLVQPSNKNPFTISKTFKK